MLVTAVVEVIDALSDRGIGFWVDGGWGVAALLGVETREHSDLDLVVDRADVAAAREALADLGFVFAEGVTPGLPARVVLRHADRRQVDLHPVVFDDDGNGWQELGDGAWGAYPHEGLSAVGRIGDVPVRCLTAELQVRHHLGYAPSEHDVADLNLLAGACDVRIPPVLRYRSG